jgi:hypothetical protein
MRKIIVSVFASVLLLASVKAYAFTADPNIQACKDSAQGARWDELRPTPKCVCPATHFNLTEPDPVAKKAVTRAVDRCEWRDINKRANANKPKVKAEQPKPVVVAPVPLPLCSPAQEVVTATNDEAINDITCTGAGVKNINRVTGSCDNCRAPRADNVIGPKTGLYVYQARVGSVTRVEKSHITVTFLTNKDQPIAVDFWVKWTPPVPPAPVDSPEKIACESRPSYGKWIPGTPPTCLCIGDKVLVNGVCVDKVVPPPAPVKKYVEGTIVHPYVEALGSYGYSKSFHSDNYGLGVGAGFDASSYLRIFGGAGLELQGGTKLDANKKPVVLADGSVDKRSTSAYFILGLQIRPIDLLGINVGVVRQMRGTTGGIVNALSVTTGGSLGASVLLPIDGATFDLGADFLVGTHQFQSFAADAEFGVIVRARVWFFNPRHLVEIQR